MMSDGSSASVSTGLNPDCDFESRSSYEWTPLSRAPPTPMTCCRSVNLLLIAQRLASVVGSTIATLASAWFRRYSSASGPKRCDSGSAIAPIWKIAM